MIRNYLLALCRQLAVAQPTELADALALLLEGAIVTAQVSGGPQSARTAKKIAILLIDDARAKALAGELGSAHAAD